jgi:hypothetical protein
VVERQIGEKLFCELKQKRRLWRESLNYRTWGGKREGHRRSLCNFNVHTGSRARSVTVFIHYKWERAVIM